MKAPKAVPVRVGRASLFDAIDAAQAKLAEEEALFKAMSPADKAAYIEKEKARQVEVEKILKDLRGPGFMEFRVK